MDFGLSNEVYPEKRSVNLSPGPCWTLVTDEDPGDIFSLSASDQVLMEVGIEDVPDKRTIEEENTIDEQHTDGAVAAVQDDDLEVTTEQEETDNATIPPYHQTGGKLTDQTRKPKTDSTLLLQICHPKRILLHGQSTLKIIDHKITSWN